MLQVQRNNYRNCAPQPRHAHAETTITLVLTGTIRERVGRGEENAGPFSYVIKPCGTEHSNEFSAHVQTLQIVIPDDEVSRFEEANNVLTQWRWCHGGPAVPGFLALLRDLDSNRKHEDAPSRTELGAIELLGALGTVAITTPGRPPVWLSRVREILDDVADAPSVRVLAKEAGVHPVYLARQFRRWYGCSITEHGRRLLARRAAEAIFRAPGTLSCASYAAGFADHAHMCRVFRRETGLTPTAFRRLIES